MRIDSQKSLEIEDMFGILIKRLENDLEYQARIVRNVNATSSTEYKEKQFLKNQLDTFVLQSGSALEENSYSTTVLKVREYLNN